MSGNAVYPQYMIGAPMNYIIYCRYTAVFQHPLFNLYDR